MRFLSKLKRRFLFFIIIYFSTVLIIYLFFIVAKTIKDLRILAFIFALLIPLILVILKISKKEKLGSAGKETTRYTMLCHRCGWEWMSHTTQKIPTKCPNCGEKNRLEPIGWRKVKILSKRNKDLRSFFKRS